MKGCESLSFPLCTFASATVQKDRDTCQLGAGMRERELGFMLSLVTLMKEQGQDLT